MPDMIFILYLFDTYAQPYQLCTPARATPLPPFKKTLLELCQLRNHVLAVNKLMRPSCEIILCLRRSICASSPSSCTRSASSCCSSCFCSCSETSFSCSSAEDLKLLVYAA